MSAIAQLKEFLLDAVEVSPAFFIGDMEAVSVALDGTFGASDSVDIELSNDEGFKEVISNWHKEGSSITAAGITEVSTEARWLRLNKTGHTNPITARIHGRALVG